MMVISKISSSIFDDEYFLNWISKNDDFIGVDADKPKFWDNFRDNHDIYGLSLNGKIEVIAVLDDFIEDYHYIELFYGNPDIHNRGYGSKLMEYVVNQYTDKPLVIEPLKTNERAIHVYQKYGFNETSYMSWEYDNGQHLKMIRYPEQ